MKNTMARGIIHHFSVAVLLTAVLLTAATGSARAGSQRPAGLLIYPRIELDGARATDTVVEIANTRTDRPTVVRCMYLWTQGRCSGSGAECTEVRRCSKGRSCEPAQCAEVDFDFQLTPGQALGWRVSEGLHTLPPTPPFPPMGSIPAAPSDPFRGELECIELEGELPGPISPTGRNDLIGSATVTTVGPDVASYTAVGIESTGTNNGDTDLCIGAKGAGHCRVAEYAPCPDTLIANHFFEGATIDGAAIETELSLVHCTQKLDAAGYDIPVNLQLVVTNEFEERRCGRFFTGCTGTLRMKNDPLFSIGVQGSLAGQTRLRGASGTIFAHGVVGVALERHRRLKRSHSAAYNLQGQGLAPINDLIRLPEFP